jgi:predicted PurR-regulated permease PerM
MNTITIDNGADLFLLLVLFLFLYIFFHVATLVKEWRTLPGDRPASTNTAQALAVQGIAHTSEEIQALKNHLRADYRQVETRLDTLTGEVNELRNVIISGVYFPITTIPESIAPSQSPSPPPPSSQRRLRRRT